MTETFAKKEFNDKSELKEAFSQLKQAVEQLSEMVEEGIDKGIEAIAEETVEAGNKLVRRLAVEIRVMK
jgi:hypothetical protein